MRKQRILNKLNKKEPPKKQRVERPKYESQNEYAYCLLYTLGDLMLNASEFCDKCDDFYAGKISENDMDNAIVKTANKLLTYSQTMACKIKDMQNKYTDPSDVEFINELTTVDLPKYTTSIKKTNSILDSFKK